MARGTRVREDAGAPRERDRAHEIPFAEKWHDAGESVAGRLPSRVPDARRHVDQHDEACTRLRVRTLDREPREREHDERGARGAENRRHRGAAHTHEIEGDGEEAPQDARPHHAQLAQAEGQRHDTPRAPARRRQRSHSQPSRSSAAR